MAPWNRIPPFSSSRQTAVQLGRYVQVARGERASQATAEAKAEESNDFLFELVDTEPVQETAAAPAVACYCYCYCSCRVVVA